MENIVETLLSHPIFMGINKNSLLRIFEKNSLTFVKYRDGDIIAEKDAPNDVLKCIVTGEIYLECANEKNIVMMEEMSAPLILAPDFHFGFDTFHPKRVIAKGNTGTIEIERGLLYKLSKENEIIFMNLLNHTARKSQLKKALFDCSYFKGEKHKLQTWILSKTYPGSRNIKIHAKIKDLTKYFGVSNQCLRQEIEVLCDLNLIHYNSSDILLPEREKLFQYYVKKREFTV